MMPLDLPSLEKNGGFGREESVGLLGRIKGEKGVKGGAEVSSSGNVIVIVRARQKCKSKMIVNHIRVPNPRKKLL